LCEFGHDAESLVETVFDLDVATRDVSECKNSINMNTEMFALNVILTLTFDLKLSGVTC